MLTTTSLKKAPSNFFKSTLSISLATPAGMFSYLDISKTFLYSDGILSKSFFISGSESTYIAFQLLKAKSTCATSS